MPKENMKTKAKSVYFVGEGPVSKSLFLRALIVKSYFPSFQIKGDSACDDALLIKKALKQLCSSQRKKENTVLDCGLSGAGLRFLALRVAREPNLNAPSISFTLKGEKSLFERPLRELISLLGQLSCETKRDPNHLLIKSAGWRPAGDALTVSCSRSSQFASAVFLNSWLLPFDLYLSLERPVVSSSYLQMSLAFLRSLGMRIEPTCHSGTNDRIPPVANKKTHLPYESALFSPVSREYYIPKGQKPRQLFYEPEQDMSCLFALSAMTVGGGEIVWTKWPEKSWQADFVFPLILQKMGFKVTKTQKSLRVTSGLKLHPIKYNIKNNPDLFPVLAALCALSEGESCLYGAPHLCYKESDRLKQVAKLIGKTGRALTVLEDGLIISGPLADQKKVPFDFDPAGDHRMAMAGAVLKQAGWPLRILNPEVVNKSFPDFWRVSRVSPN